MAICLHDQHSSAVTHHWNNVAEYDYTFKQLMSTYLRWSWAKTYVQGWNLAMHDPIVKHQGGGYKGSDNNCWQFN